jgi:hypothetical protein
MVLLSLSVLVLLGSVVYYRVYLPTPGDDNDNSVDNNTDIIEPDEDTEIPELVSYAETAWKYFKPGVGVDPETGLNYANYAPPFGGWKCLTEWDLGCYIMAIVDAEKLGILDTEGEWGCDYRVEKVLGFMEDREIHESGVPYLSYKSTSSEPNNYEPTNKYDVGRLLVALHNLKKSKPEQAARIDHIVHERYNLTGMAASISKSPNPENYYLAKGYSYFGFNSTNIHACLGNPRRMIEGGQIDVYGVSLPNVKLISEQVLHAVFEVETDGDFQEIAHRTYLAQQRRWEETGKYTAFTEGARRTEPHYIYEYIVLPPDTWYVTAIGMGDLDLVPIVFIKAGVGFHAIYNTSYTRDLLDEYLERVETDNGYMEGVDEDGAVMRILTDKTNSLIINAARYRHAQEHNLKEVN